MNLLKLATKIETKMPDHQPALNPGARAEANSRHPCCGQRIVKRILPSNGLSPLEARQPAV